MKPVYEIVRAEDVRVGDIVSSWPVHGEMHVTQEILNTWRFDDEDDFMYRQLPPERNPEVLMRALEIQQREMIDACIGNPIERTIEQAIHELESKGQQ